MKRIKSIIIITMMLLYIDGEYRLTDYFVLKEKIRVYTTFLDTKI